MIQLCTKDKEKVLEAIRQGEIDAADVSCPNIINAMILKMKIKTSLTNVPFAITNAETLRK